MKKTGWNSALAGAAALSALLVPAHQAAADESQSIPREDPPVTTSTGSLPPGFETPADVQPAPSGHTRFKDLYYLSAKSTSGGYIEVAARDNPARDAPGTATTTLRVYGNAAAFRDGPGGLGLNSKFTCTGAGVSGLSVGSSGASVSGGTASSTLSWASLRDDSSTLRQYYTEGGHFRCKASNLTLAKFTRRGTASANYKNRDTRAEDSYSFTW
jgi:hypothetical protein